MSKKKQPEFKKGAPLWMTSYADMMSLLLCFFVLLFALSDVDESFLVDFLIAFGNPTIALATPVMTEGIDNMMGMGAIQMPTPPSQDGEITEEDGADALDQLHEDLRSMVLDFITYFTESQNPLADNVNVALIDDRAVLTFDSDMVFESGSAVLMPGVLEILDYVASVLAQYPFFDIHIHGHTDNVPINTPQFPSNWELGAGRAISVLRHFSEVHNIDVLRLRPQTFGEFSPIATNLTPEGRALNRRVEIIIAIPEF